MALITCGKCGNSFSDKATECPRCGNILTHRNKSRKWGLAVGIVALCCLVGCVVWYFAYLSKESSKNESVTDDVVVVHITPQFSEKVRAYSEVSDFSEGYAAVQRGGKWGYIDAEGNEVISCRYDYAYPFYDGIAKVNIDGRYKYIDINALEATDGAYRYHKPDSVANSQYILFKSSDELYGYKDANGNIVVPAKFNSLKDFHNGVALAKIEKTEFDPNDINVCEFYGYVDTKGNSTFTDYNFDAIAEANETARNNQQRQREELAHEREIAEQQHQIEQQRQNASPYLVFSDMAFVKRFVGSQPKFVTTRNGQNHTFGLFIGNSQRTGQEAMVVEYDGAQISDWRNVQILNGGQKVRGMIIADAYTAIPFVIDSSNGQLCAYLESVPASNRPSDVEGRVRNKALGVTSKDYKDWYMVYYPTKQVNGNVVFSWQNSDNDLPPVKYIYSR